MDHSGTDSPIVLTTAGAAKKLLMSPDALRSWRRRGRGPRFIRLGRSIRYAEEDLSEFVKRSKVEPKPSPKRDRQGIEASGKRRPR